MQQKIRVYRLAKELGQPPKAFEEIVREAGVAINNYMSTLTPEEAQRVRDHVARRGSASSAVEGEARRAKKSGSRVVVRRRRAADTREAATPAAETAPVRRSAETGPIRRRTEATAPRPPKPSPRPEPTPVEGADRAARAPAEETKGPSGPNVVRDERGVIVGTRKRAEPKILGFIRVEQPSRKREVVVQDATEQEERRGRASQRKARVERTLSTGRRRKRSQRREARPSRPSTQEMSEAKRRVRVDGVIRVSELAHEMGEKAGSVLKALWKLGLRGVTLNHTIDAETASLIAGEFGYTVDNVAFDESELIASTKVDHEGEPRAPVVTVMGHVDHGKTSLLDRIRRTAVAEGEAGGITQHIGAYKVTTNKGDVVFLDTPGHEAFSAMRSRGARMTDVVVLVVAADDGVMPTTVEAIEAAKRASVPIVVAVNKMDVPDANPGRAKQQLMEYGLVGEEFGGDTIVCELSAKTGEGVETLLEALALQTEMLELRAPRTGPAQGVVIESRVDKGRGPVATVLVQAGILKKGDVVVVQEHRGKARSMTDHAGKLLRKAGPSTPVEIVGLDGLPSAGDALHVVESDKAAKQLVEHRRESRLRSAKADNVVSIDEFLRRKSKPTLRLVLKADVAGSVEALQQALEGLSTDKVRVEVPSAGVGSVSESDVKMAKASEAMIVAFNVPTGPRATALAKTEGVDIHDFSIIYEALERTQELMLELLEPEYTEREQGEVEVRAVFRVPKVGTVAGCRVTQGRVHRHSLVRVLRDGEVIHAGRIASLRVFKNDVSEVGEGRECGIALEGFDDLRGGEVLQTYELQAVQPSL